MPDVTGELSALRERLDKLEAREQIRQQIARYGRGQEWLDLSLLNEVFFDDAEVDFGFFKGVWTDYRPVLMEIEARGKSTFHLCACEQIELDLPNNRAFVEVYGIAGSRQQDDSVNVFGGRYIDRWERRQDTWKIAARQYVLDWNLNGAAPSREGEFAALNMFPDRSPQHPRFRRMGYAET